MAELNCRPQQYLRGSVARLAARSYPSWGGVVLYDKGEEFRRVLIGEIGDIPCPALLEVVAAVFSKDLVALADGGDSGSPYRCFWD